MGVEDRIQGWFLSFMARYMLPVIAVLILVSGVTDLRPSWRAESGHGVAGTFTADRRECARQGCWWYGEFVADDGSVDRPDVWMYGASKHSLHVGARVPAIDTGDTNKVYPPGGHVHEWAVIVVMLILSPFVLAISVGTWWWWIRRHLARRRERRERRA